MGRRAPFLFACGLLLAHLCQGVRSAGNESMPVSEQMAIGEQQLSEQIKRILKHYQQPDPIGIPGAPIPDPMDVPDMKHSFSVFTMNLQKIKVHGLSKFRINHIRSELALMQVSVALNIEKLDIRGLYTLASWLSRSSGDFSVNLTSVNVLGLARLEVGNDGKLYVQDIEMDLTFEKIDMDFKNLGFFAAVFQGVINSVGSFIFDSIKPYILKEVNTNVRGEVNKHISNLPNYFPNSISPFDMAVAEARKQVAEMGYDPYKIADYTQNMGIFTVTSSHTWVTGLASFYRMGNITLSMENGTVYAVMDVGTQEIVGKTHWEVSLVSGVLSRAGSASFSVEYFRVKVNVSQPLDTRKRATLEDIDFELGNIQARVDGTGTIDYIIEAGINIVPNLLRYQIMDAIEGPVRKRIQDELDKVDVEKLIHDKIPDIAEQARKLQSQTSTEEILLVEEPSTPAPTPPASDDEETFSISDELAE